MKWVESTEQVTVHPADQELPPRESDAERIPSCHGRQQRRVHGRQPAASKDGKPYNGQHRRNPQFEGRQHRVVHFNINDQNVRLDFSYFFLQLSVPQRAVPKLSRNADLFEQLPWPPSQGRRLKCSRSLGPESPFPDEMDELVSVRFDGASQIPMTKIGDVVARSREASAKFKT